MKWLTLLTLLSAGAVWAQEGPRTVFHVRYVAAGSVYLDGGREAGLSEGFHLTLKRVKPGDPVLPAPVVGEVTIISVAANSAVCEITSKAMDPLLGDTAILATQDAEAVSIAQQSKTMRRYAQVVSFSDGDPLDEEAREYVVKPPLPEINRVRGSVAIEYGRITDFGGASYTSTQAGLVVRADVTRIGGSFWNFTGYWRGRLNSYQSAGGQATLDDLINRTYHVGFYYQNPGSRYVAGFGRLLIPWAPSLTTIDGGYFGRRLGKYTTAAVFGGTAPDPSSWSYAADREIGGALLNVEAGSYDRVRFSSTAGLAITRRSWQAEREFLFLENSLSFGSRVSVYHGLQLDKLTLGRFGQDKNGLAVTQSFLTTRVKVHNRVTVDVNHNQFRGVPTFDTRLLGTGLLDRFLFQGLSAGARIELPARTAFYFSLGRNKRETEAKASWNEMGGLTFANFLDTGMRFDVRFSRYNSSFGRGEYYTGSLMRQITDKIRFEVQGGQQLFVSQLSQQNRAIFVTSSLDWYMGAHYWLGFSNTLYRGEVQRYDQMFFTMGYRQ